MSGNGSKHQPDPTAVHEKRCLKAVLPQQAFDRCVSLGRSTSAADGRDCPVGRLENGLGKNLKVLFLRQLCRVLQIFTVEISALV